MPSSLAELLYGNRPPARPRVFVSYHHGGDQWYYDKFSETLHDYYETVIDRSLERRIDSDNSEYIMRRIREEYITGTSCTFVLCGLETPKRKFVDWEIKASLDKQHGLIGVQLPSAQLIDRGLFFKPWRLDDNVASGYAVLMTWSDVITYPSLVANRIAEANARPKTLINNSRAMMVRNA